MQLYRKEILPYKYVPGAMGWHDTMDPLEDWQPEENMEMLQLRYTKFDDSWASLKFKERFVPVDS